MKNNLISKIALLVMVTLLSSFVAKKELPVIGVYGVSKDDPSQIELVINSDHSFTYKDYSNPSKPINVKGNWSDKENSVVLEATDARSAFHKKWKISGNVAKSRKGLTFYRLCRIN